MLRETTLPAELDWGCRSRIALSVCITDSCGRRMRSRGYWCRSSYRFCARKSKVSQKAISAAGAKPDEQPPVWAPTYIIDGRKKMVSPFPNDGPVCDENNLT